MLSGGSMGISVFQKILKCVERFRGQELSRAGIIALVIKEFPGTRAGSIIPSDYCYNIINRGADFKNHIFEYIEKDRGGVYKCLGKNFPYSGNIAWREKGAKRPERKVIGMWVNGKFEIYKEFRNRFIV